MKVLVTGGNGQVGWELQQTKPEHVELFAFNSTELDITNVDQVNQRFEEVQPDVVINAAAYTAVDKAEEEPKKAFLVNATGAENIANACAKSNARMIHISTDFVFDGKKNTPYKTDDITNPLNIYGKSKLEGEAIIRKTLVDYGIVRTSWLYSHTNDNFVKSMLRLFRQRESIGIVSDQIGRPTAVSGLSQYLWNNVVPRQGYETLHYADLGVASWFDFAVAIHELAIEFGLLRKEVNIFPISAVDFSAAALRPSYSVLDVCYKKDNPELEFEHWRRKLRQVLVKFSEK